MNLNLKLQKMTPFLDQEHFSLNDAGFCIAVVLSDESIIYIYIYIVREENMVTSFLLWEWHGHDEQGGAGRFHLAHALFKMWSKSASHNRTPAVHAIKHVLSNSGMWETKHIKGILAPGLRSSTDINITNCSSCMSRHLCLLFLFIIKPVVKSQASCSMCLSCYINNEWIQQLCKHILCLSQLTTHMYRQHHSWMKIGNPNKTHKHKGKAEHLWANVVAVSAYPTAVWMWIQIDGHTATNFQCGLWTQASSEKKKPKKKNQSCKNLSAFGKSQDFANFLFHRILEPAWTGDLKLVITIATTLLLLLHQCTTTVKNSLAC